MVLQIPNTIILYAYVAIKMEPGYITEDVHIERRNITISNEAVTQLFSTNQLDLTHTESEFCMDRLWSKVHGMLMRVKTRRAVPVV